MGGNRIEKYIPAHL